MIHNEQQQPRLPYCTTQELQGDIVDMFKKALQSGNHNFAHGLHLAGDIEQITGRSIIKELGTVYGTILFEDFGTLALPFVNPKDKKHAHNPKPHFESSIEFAKSLGRLWLPRWSLYIWKFAELATEPASETSSNLLPEFPLYVGYAYVTRDEISKSRERVQQEAVLQLLTMMPEFELYKPALNRDEGLYVNIRTGEHFSDKKFQQRWH